MDTIGSMPCRMRCFWHPMPRSDVAPVWAFNGGPCRHYRVTLSTAPTLAIPSGTQLTFSSMSGVFKPGDVVTGVTSAASGTVVRINYTEFNINKVAGVFLANETVP